jgi:3-oxoacid CoA-transferase subunit B
MGLTTHQDRKGRSKIVHERTLPLTARACVDRIFTDLAVIDVTPDGLALREIADGLSVEDVVNATDAPLIRPTGELKVFWEPYNGYRIENPDHAGG